MVAAVFLVEQDAQSIFVHLLPWPSLAQKHVYPSQQAQNRSGLLSCSNLRGGEQDSPTDVPQQHHLPTEHPL